MRVIHLQSDFKYAVWSTVSDGYIAWDATKDEAVGLVLDWTCRDAKVSALRNADAPPPVDEAALERDKGFLGLS